MECLDGGPSSEGEAKTFFMTCTNTGSDLFLDVHPMYLLVRAFSPLRLLSSFDTNLVHQQLSIIHLHNFQLPVHLCIRSKSEQIQASRCVGWNSAPFCTFFKDVLNCQGVCNGSISVPPTHTHATASQPTYSGTTWTRARDFAALLPALRSARSGIS